MLAVDEQTKFAQHVDREQWWPWPVFTGGCPGEVEAAVSFSFFGAWGLGDVDTRRPSRVRRLGLLAAAVRGLDVGYRADLVPGLATCRARWKARSSV